MGATEASCRISCWSLTADPQKLERLAAVAHGFLLPPLPVGLSVLGVVFGDIVFEREEYR